MKKIKKGLSSIIYLSILLISCKSHDSYIHSWIYPTVYIDKVPYNSLGKHLIAVLDSSDIKLGYFKTHNIEKKYDKGEIQIQYSISSNGQYNLYYSGIFKSEKQFGKLTMKILKSELTKQGIEKAKAVVLDFH